MRFRISSLVLVVAVAVVGCGSASAPTTTSPVPLVRIVLAEDGLGDVLFGLDPDTTIADISVRFGGVDFDSDWIPAEPNIFGSCPGESMRAVSWGSLTTIFVDDGASELGGWFYTYTYGYDYTENEGGIDPRELNLATELGIGLGSTVTELQLAYGDTVGISGDADLDIWSFTIADAGLRGLLSGPQPDAVVTLIEPLTGCH